jgi:hypothetical protein
VKRPHVRSGSGRIEWGAGLVIVLCLVGVTGCATLTRVQPGSGSRLTVEGRTYDEIWKAATTVIGRNLVTQAGTDKGRGEIQAAGAGGTFTSGSLVGVFITPANVASDRYVVEVVRRRSDAVPLPAKDWEDVLIRALKTELKL